VNASPGVDEWVLERSPSERFPFRLQLLAGGRVWLALRVQDRWPSVSRRIFCLREAVPPDGAEELVEVERLRVIAVQQRGPRLSLVLDRKRNSRCDFLFLSRRGAGSPGREYEQIFWQTQQSLRQHRPRVRLAMPRQAPGLTIAIATDERYPWRFTGATVTRRKLKSGDYALMDGDSEFAVVERKTFENLQTDLALPQVLHQRLLELTALAHHALVVEAPYEDFLNPRKVRGFSPSYYARVIGELYAYHPGLRLVFCANRKTANAWTHAYFQALWARRRSEEAELPVDRRRRSLAEGEGER
jgi:hypothetical protein